MRTNELGVVDERERKSPREKLFQVGAENERDPNWLQAHTSIEEIEMWLCDIKPHLHAEGPKSRMTKSGRVWGSKAPIFSEYEREFFVSIDKQYDDRIARGFDQFPLSGKQLVILRSMWVKLANSNARLVETMR